jgi:hypothetical protein
MIEYYVPVELLDKLFEQAPMDVTMREYIDSVLDSVNGRRKDDMNFTFIFETDKDLTMFLLRWA